ncbi:MAG: FAD-binding oxidoreductase, partial [Isosphaeraceae bacterium]
MKIKLQKMLRDDLGDLFRGNLVAENVRLSGYSTDSSLWERQPLAAVAPRDTSELLVLLAYAREKGLTLHSRGAGLGVTGESLGSGIVVDFSQHLRRLVAIDHDSVTIQPGMTLGDLQISLAQLGRSLASFPADAGAMTMGGWLSGLSLSGTPQRPGLVDTLRRVQLLKSDSTIVELGPVPVSSITGQDENPDWLRQLLMLVSWRSDLFGRLRGGSMADVPGLVFSGVMDAEAGQFHPHRLVSGARGTLGMLLEMTLETVPLKPWSVYATIGFDLPERAADAAMKLPWVEKLESAEILDWRSIALA